MVAARYRVLATGVAGSPAYLTFYVDQPIAGVPQDIVDAFEDYMNVVTNYMYNGVTVTGDSQVVFFDPVTGEAVGASDVTPFTQTGTGGLSLLPPSTQALATLRTNMYAGGRLVRGRLNLPYFSEDQNDTSGQLTTAVITQLDIAADIVLSSTSFEWSVWSRKLASLVPLSTVEHERKWAVLRSRRD